MKKREKQEKLGELVNYSSNKMWRTPNSNHLFQPIQDVVRHIEKGYRMEPPEGCPLEISRLMNEAWILEPSIRPSFCIILQRLKLVCTNIASVLINKINIWSIKFWSAIISNNWSWRIVMLDFFLGIFSIAGLLMKYCHSSANKHL